MKKIRTCNMKIESTFWGSLVRFDSYAYTKQYGYTSQYLQFHKDIITPSTRQLLRHLQYNTFLSNGKCTNNKRYMALGILDHATIENTNGYFEISNYIIEQLNKI